MHSFVLTYLYTHAHTHTQQDIQSKPFFSMPSPLLSFFQPSLLSSSSLQSALFSLCMHVQFLHACWVGVIRRDNIIHCSHCVCPKAKGKIKHLTYYGNEGLWRWTILMPFSIQGHFCYIYGVCAGEKWEHANNKHHGSTEGFELKLFPFCLFQDGVALRSWHFKRSEASFSNKGKKTFWLLLLMIL